MSFWDPDNRSGSRRLSLGRALPELLQIKEKNYRNFDVPIGTEVTVANLEPVVLHGDQPGGGCGGGDESFFVLDRSFLFDGDRFLKDKFVAFLDQGLRAFAGRDRSGRMWEYSVGKGELSVLKIAPFTSSYHVKMRVASEVSRRVAGRWDSFEVWFDPAELVEELGPISSRGVASGPAAAAEGLGRRHPTNFSGYFLMMCSSLSLKRLRSMMVSPTCCTKK